MIVLDPGHKYVLDYLDGATDQAGGILTFVKREGPKYPGNVGSYPGTTTQEVLRGLIERSEYVNGQRPCSETSMVISLLKTALWLLEARAARLHGRAMEATITEVVTGCGKCVRCGHVGCEGNCHAARR